MPEFNRFPQKAYALELRILSVKKLSPKLSLANSSQVCVFSAANTEKLVAANNDKGSKLIINITKITNNLFRFIFKIFIILSPYLMVDASIG